MPTMWETFPIKFEGGLRTDLGRLDHGLQAPGSATVLKNFEASINGGYSKIKGFEKFSSSDVDAAEDDPVIGVIVADESTAVARKGDNYYKSTGAAWTEILTVATTGATRIHFDHYNFDGTEKIVVVDGRDDPAFYNVNAGTMAFDTSAPTDVTGASIVRVHKNHIFYAKDNLLSFTAPFTDDDYNTGNGAGAINIGNDITGLIVFRDQLIIFTVDSINRLEGNTAEDFVLQPITTKTGCLSSHTVQEVGGDVLYLGPDGVRWLSATERNSDFGLERASSTIQDEIIRVINSSGGYASTVIRSKNQYRIFLYQTSVTKKFSEGFIATKYTDQSTVGISWSKIVGMKVYSVDSRQFDDREIVLFTSEDGYVYKMESSNGFDGVAINYVFETPYMPINDPRVRKTIYKHSIYLESGGTFSIAARLKFDYNLSGSIQPPYFSVDSVGSSAALYGSAIYGTSLYGTSGTSETLVSPTVGSGFVVALRYEGEDTNSPITLDHTVLEFRNNERR